MTGIAFDVLLAAYLLDTNDNNADIEGVAQHADMMRFNLMKPFMEKGQKACQGRRRFSLVI